MAPSPPPDASPVSFRRLLGLARPEARRLAIATLFLLLGSGLSLIYPQAMRIIIDEAMGAKDPGLVDRAAMVMGGVFVIQAIAVAMRSYIFTTAGERIVARLRELLYRRLLDQEIGFFDQRKTGELVSRLGSDTTVLQNTVSVNISMALRSTATALGGIALLVYTSPILTLLMLAVVPPVALGAVAYGRRVRKLSREVQDAVAGASEVAEETLSGLRTVRSFAAEPVEGARYGAKVQRAFELARRRARATATFMGVASFAGFAASVVVLWYGGRLVVTDAMSVGQLTSFLVYSLMVAFSLGALGDVWADFMRASGAAQRVFELLDRVPLIPARGGERPSVAGGRIDLSKVTFAYPARPDVRVLDAVTLAIAPGERVALVGPSGGGKSTIAALLARFYDPSEGWLSLDGRDLRELDPSWLRQQIGSVAQEPLLFSSSVAENIRYGRAEASEGEVETAARAANAHDFIALFPEGYATVVGERGVQLSGGQKQRIAIARAVLKDPRILVLDEATSALDAESEHLVKEALERLMHGRTTLIIAHRLSTVMDADRVLVIEAGKVVQQGSHRALLEEEGLYRRLVERQFVAA